MNSDTLGQNSGGAARVEVGTEFRPVPERCSGVTGSALHRAASYAAACIVHHKRWPRYADEKHRVAMRIIERDISAILVRITEDCCSCGGLPAEDPSACAACQVYHQLFNEPNSEVSDRTRERKARGTSD